MMTTQLNVNRAIKRRAVEQIRSALRSAPSDLTQQALYLFLGNDGTVLDAIHVLSGMGFTPRQIDVLVCVSRFNERLVIRLVARIVVLSIRGIVANFPKV